MSLPLRKVNLSARSLYFYYDVVSPYAWIAFELLTKCKSAWDVDIKLRPIYLAELRRRRNDNYPERNDAKFRYVCRDAERLGKYYNIPIKTPHDAESKLLHLGSLSAMKLLTTINDLRPELTEAASRAFWTRLWAKDRDIVERKSMMQIGDHLGLSEKTMEDFLYRSKAKSTSIRLTAVTAEALKKGAFDAPTIVVDDEKTTHLISGADRMQILSQILEHKDETPKLD